MQGEMSQGRNVAQGEMSLREKCRREKSRREKCRREKCLSGRNVVQSCNMIATLKVGKSLSNCPAYSPVPSIV